MSLKLDWSHGEPLNQGLYFVAIKSGNVGVYDFVIWSGNCWETDEKGEVIAHIDAHKLIGSLDIEWPEKSDFQYTRKPILESDDELWSED